MVVTASDSLAASAGLAPNATGDMPQTPVPGMPTADVPASSTEMVPADAAATAEADAPFDLSTLSDAQREYLTSQLIANETEKFQQDRVALQQRLESQNTDLRNRNASLSDQSEMSLRVQNELVKWLGAYVQQHGDPQRDMAALASHLESIQKDATQQKILATHQFSQWEADQNPKFVNHLTSMSRDGQGRELFSPRDPDILAAWDEVRRNAFDHQVRGDQRAQQAATLAQRKLDDLIRQKREAGFTALSTQDRQRIAREQQDVLARQQERGPQDTARGGAGGAARLSPQEARAQAAQESNDPTERIAIALRLLNPRQAP